MADDIPGWSICFKFHSVFDHCSLWSSKGIHPTKDILHLSTKILLYGIRSDLERQMQSKRKPVKWNVTVVAAAAVTSDDNTCTTLKVYMLRQKPHLFILRSLKCDGIGQCHDLSLSTLEVILIVFNF